MDFEPTEDQVRSYLLAELSEAERAKLEEAYFADDELFNFVRAVEADLIDDFVSGALDAADRRRFTEHFLTSPERRTRVELARGLRQAALETSLPLRGVAPVPVHSPATDRGHPPPREAFDGLLAALRQLFALDRPRMLAFGTAAVVVALSGAVLWQWTRPGGQPTVQDTTGAALIKDQTIVLAQLGPLPPELSSSVRTMITTGSTPVASQVAPLLEGLRDATRATPLNGSTSALSTLVPISPVLTGVRSEQPTLRWQPVSGTGRYQVTVGDRDNKKVWESGGIAGTEVSVPPGVLQRGAQYFWQVEALLDRNPASSRVGFWLIDGESLKSIEAVEQAYRGSALVLAATFQQYGLYEEALAQVDRLAVLNPGSATIEAMRAHLNERLAR